jgi:hypothetical protein
MTQTLFKAINLSVEDLGELTPFFSSISFQDNKIALQFKMKIQQINKDTRELETLEIPTEGINQINKTEGFLGGDFVNEMYCVYFDSVYLPLLRSLYQFVDQVTGEFKQPYSVGDLEQKQTLIDTIQSQIDQSKKQAKEWEQDLENVKYPELKRMRNDNELFEDTLLEAKKAGLINA